MFGYLIFIIIDVYYFLRFLLVLVSTEKIFVWPHFQREKGSGRVRVVFPNLFSVSGNVLKHGLSCLIYYRKRNTNDARLSLRKMKRDVKFLSNESVLHLHEKKNLARKTNFTWKVFCTRLAFKRRVNELGNFLMKLIPFELFFPYPN